MESETERFYWHGNKKLVTLLCDVFLLVFVTNSASFLLVNLWILPVLTHFSLDNKGNVLNFHPSTILDQTCVIKRRTKYQQNNVKH